MDTTSQPSPRIGQAERAEAQRLLDEHLTAGRLHMNEYADRFAAAGNATVASELAVLFSDLPAPHPKLPGFPGSGGSRTARNAIIAVVIVGLVIAAAVLVVGLSGHGGGQVPTAAPTVTPTSDFGASTTSPVSPTTDANSPGGPTDATGAPPTATIRHQGPLRIVAGGQELDLDARQSDAQWGENDSSATGDIGIYSESIAFYNGTRYVLLGSRKADYQACATVNGYIDGRIGYRDLAVGNYLCILTSGKRYVAAEITAISNSSVDMSVVSYDPALN